MNFLNPALKGKSLVLLVTGLLFIVFTGCTKLESTKLGGNLIPGTDGLYTDTIQLPVSTTSFIEQDTIKSAKDADQVLGFINDPVFGTTTASMFFQMRPTSYPFTYPVSKDSLFLDSCVLSLGVTGTYGDTNAITKVNLYKINDATFIPSKLYKYSEGINYSTADLLGSATFSAHSIRTGYKAAYKTDTIYNQLRIRMDNTFAQWLLEQNNTTGAFQDDSVFRSKLNGLALITDSLQSGNALHYFSLANANSRINLYFRYKKRDASISVWDTTVQTFTFVNHIEGSTNANKIYRKYTGAAATALTSGQPASIAYIEATPGTAVKIQIPGLDTMKNRPYIIHRAEIVARQVFQGPVATEQVLTPPVLQLYTYDASNNVKHIPYDSSYYFKFEGSTGFLVNTNYTGGKPSFVKDNSGNTIAEYRLNITRYVQAIVNSKTDNLMFKLAAPHFDLYTSGIFAQNLLNSIGGGRVQLGGGTHPSQRMYVCIYYSKQ